MSLQQANVSTCTCTCTGFIIQHDRFPVPIMALSFLYRSFFYIHEIFFLPLPIIHVAPALTGIINTINCIHLSICWS